MRIHQFGVFAALLSLATMVPGFRDHGPEAAGQPHPVVRYATRSDTTAPLRAMPEIPPLPPVIGEIFVKPLKRLPNRLGSAGTSGLDPVAQETFPSVAAPATGTGFEGVGANGWLPPDPSGAIGPNHYVQTVNIAFQVFDRTTGASLYGPVDNNTLWQGFGGPCENNNDGDPIVLYDQLADRWLMSQFALPGPFYQCIAISKTPDPTGAWHRYQFQISVTKINDYPKFGVWPDGYYMAVNQFQCGVVNCSWGGQGVVVFERDEMLIGGNARGVYFDLLNLDSSLGGMLPADLDGPTPPPAGAPNPFVQMDDDAWGYPSDQLQFWNFHVDWSNPSNSTFTFDRALTTAAFDTNLCGYSRNCIPQPGGTPVDAISDRLMYRLQYRNFGTHESMVVNHTVDVGGDHAGVRWYELRDGGAGWGIHQEGTYAPDSDHRWMGSIAMNGAGDIGLGYSVSSGTTYPSIRFTGRLGTDDSDPLNDDEMTQGEGEIIAGNGYQTHSSGRWGDYSQMTVDPLDDCTFWYTQEYYGSGGASNAGWQTRIGSFKLRDCGPVDPVDTPPDVGIVDPVEGATVFGIYHVLVDASDDTTISKVELSIDGDAYIDITVDFDGAQAFYDWDTNIGDGGHTLQARATDNASQSTESTLVSVTVANVNDPPIAAFDFACLDLACNFDASSSIDPDPDGSISGYAWDFGGGNLDSDVTASFEFATAGTHPVNLTVTDNDGATDSIQKDVAVSAPVVWLHVASIDGASASAPRNRWAATATTEVHDADHELVYGAVVNGTWSNGANGSSSCTTDAVVPCEITRTNIKGNVASVRFTVVDVTDAADANYEVGTDIAGDSIEIFKDSQLAGNQSPTASFTYNCDASRFCTFVASDSSDPDGSITNYSWTFGDGSSTNDSADIATNTYATDGTFPVILTVTDNESATGMDNQNVTVGTPTTVIVHVGDLDGSSVGAPRNRWEATVTVAVHNEGHGAVSGVDVSGSWSNGANGGGSCTTDGSGQCTITKSNIKNNAGSADFTVNGIAGTGYSYTGANHDPDGDSNGTVITVAAP